MRQHFFQAQYPEGDAIGFGTQSTPNGDALTFDIVGIALQGQRVDISVIIPPEIVPELLARINAQFNKDSVKDGIRTLIKALP